MEPHHALASVLPTASRHANRPPGPPIAVHRSVIAPVMQEDPPEMAPAPAPAAAGVLSLWDGVFARIRANDKLHLLWCCGGVIGCLVA